MPFPISIRGAIDLAQPPASPSSRALIIACADRLEREGARVLSRTDIELEFRVPVFLRWVLPTWLVPFLSSGTFRVDGNEANGGRSRLEYELSLRRSVLAALIAPALVLLLLQFGPRIVTPSGTAPSTAPPAAVYYFLPFIFFWIITVPYVWAMLRVRSWCRRRVDEALEADVTMSAIAQHGIQLRD
jgi:hypothetical protein